MKAEPVFFFGPQCVTLRQLMRHAGDMGLIPLPALPHRNAGLPTLPPLRHPTPHDPLADQPRSALGKTHERPDRQPRSARGEVHEPTAHRPRSARGKLHERPDLQPRSALSKGPQLVDRPDGKKRHGLAGSPRNPGPLLRHRMPPALLPLPERCCPGGTP